MNRDIYNIIEKRIRDRTSGKIKCRIDYLTSSFIMNQTNVAVNSISLNSTRRASWESAYDFLQDRYE